MGERGDRDKLAGIEDDRSLNNAGNARTTDSAPTAPANRRSRLHRQHYLYIHFVKEDDMRCSGSSDRHGKGGLATRPPGFEINVGSVNKLGNYFVLQQARTNCRLTRTKSPRRPSEETCRKISRVPGSPVRLSYLPEFPCNQTFPYKAADLVPSSEAISASYITSRIVRRSSVGSHRLASQPPVQFLST